MFHAAFLPNQTSFSSSLPASKISFQRGKRAGFRWSPLHFAVLTFLEAGLLELQSLLLCRHEPLLPEPLLPEPLLPEPLLPEPVLPQRRLPSYDSLHWKVPADSVSRGKAERVRDLACHEGGHFLRRLPSFLPSFLYFVS